VVKKTVTLKQKPYIPSKLAYIAGVVLTLIKKPGVKARISCDGSELTAHKYLLTTFAVGEFCGGGFHSNPRAALSDGKIDALFINDISRLKFVSLVGSYKKGTHLIPKNDPIISNQKLEKILLQFDEKQSVSIDGELFDFNELSLECIKGALNFLIPEGMSFKGERLEEYTSVS
jgi:diacylglycerol kinase family enzyme